MSGGLRVDYRERVTSGAFVGCPLDADRYALALLAELAALPAPGARRVAHYWKRAYEAPHASAIVPTQYLIPRTSDPAIGPIYILFADTIGTPVPPPPEGWAALRRWLDANGFGNITLLGERGFTDPERVPRGRVPLTGTLFELVDAMRREDTVELRVFRVRGSPTVSRDGARRQRRWLERFLADFARQRAVVELDERDFRERVRPMVRRTLGFGARDPLCDPLPGLEAVSDGSLLFGRRDLLTRLGDRVSAESARCTLVVGVSGAGKSSLLGAGLARDLFPHHALPKVAGLSALITEPLMLAELAEPAQRVPTLSSIEALERLDTVDPLLGLAHMLRSGPAPERRHTLLPHALPSVPEPPPLTRDRAADLDAALTWWETIARSLDGPLVFVLDQAERIDAIARRIARARVERDAEAEHDPALSAGWWRFTALLSLLAGVGDPKALGARACRRGARLVEQHELRCVLGLHRRAALTLWPLAQEHLPTPLDVPPLATRAELAEVIEGTMLAYGLNLDPALRDAMADEAATLAESDFSVRTPTPDSVVVLDTTKRASVLPQLATALGNLIEAWREVHGASYGTNPAAGDIDAATFGEAACVASSIDTLGERAWQSWRTALGERLGLDSRGHFAARQLERQQRLRFDALMRTLVDAGDTERRDLAYLPRSSAVAHAEHDLVDALASHRLLVGIGARYWRLPHRSVIDHWGRATTWLVSLQPLLEAKTAARALRTSDAVFGGVSTWPEPALDAMASLALRWVGNDVGDDARLREWLIGALVARLDPTRIDRSSASAYARLPVEAILEGEVALAERLLARALELGAPESVLAEMLIAAAQEGHRRLVRTLLDTDPERARARASAVDAGSGINALLAATAHARTSIAGDLLDAGAPIDHVMRDLAVDALTLATEAGDAALVRRLIAEGASADGNFPSADAPPLLVAARDGSVEIVTTLLAAGADPDRRHARTDDTPLNVAAREGHGDIVTRLLAAGAQPDAIAASSGTFPLLSAAFSGDVVSVRALLTAGAAPDRRKADSGESALMIAAGLGHVSVLEALLDAGAEPDAPSPDDDTSGLLLAAERGHVAVVERLISAGALVARVQRDCGWSALLLAAGNGCEAVVERLLDAGAPPDPAPASNGTFPLLMAAQNGHVGIVARLLESGAAVTRVNPLTGEDALAHAAQNGHVAVIRLLLAHGADARRRNARSGNTALALAATDGHAEVVSMLLEAGADPETFDRETDAYALELAAQEGHAEVVRLLLEAGADPRRTDAEPGPDALYLAAGDGHLDVVEQLLEAGADPDRVDPEDGSFALLIAAQEGECAVVERLLAAGASPDRTSDATGTFALLIAAQEGHLGVVETLLAHGADPDQCDPVDGGFPLVNAAQEGRLEIVETLLAHGAQVDRVDTLEGSTALSMSVERGHLGVLERLLAANADPSLRNPVSGRSPLAIALETDDVRILETLLAHGAASDTALDPGGATALMRALELERPAHVRALLAAGATARELPTQLRGQLETLLANENGSADAGDRPRPEPDERPSRVTPPPSAGLPGQWIALDSGRARREYVDERVRALGIAPENARIGHARLSIALPPGLSVRRARIDDGASGVTERLWLQPGGARAPVAIEPGLSLDAVLHEYAVSDLVLDLRGEDEVFAFAALVLLTADPSRQPLPPGAPLPFAPGQPGPTLAYAGDRWRTWQLVPAAGGRYVRLPWIVGSALLRGKVLVTHSGVGSRILEERDVVCDDIGRDR